MITIASQNPFPLMPPKSTELRLMHFDEYAYSGDTSSNLYKLVDALCGTTGAGALVNEIFLARMGGALETMYFQELDVIFGKINFLARSPAESYPYNPLVDMLTSDQWTEVRVKDAWYRARIKEFFQACNLGGTPDGIRMAVHSALATDCDIYEVWRYVDNFGITASLGRANSARNEVVIKPHKATLIPQEVRLVRDMLDKLMPMETIVTVNTSGLAVISPVPVNAAAADSYYEVQKMVTATPALDQLPPPELLTIDLLPTERWLYDAQSDPALAPYTAFNITQEYGYYYLEGGGSRSPIDSTTYGTIKPGRTGTITVYELSGTIMSIPGTDIIGALEQPIAGFLRALGVQVVPPQGIFLPPMSPGPSVSYFRDNLDPDIFNYVGVPYPAVMYPMNNSVAAGAATLTQMILNTPGKFIIIGTGQGAMAASNVYDQLRSGSLQSRKDDLLAAITFSNPRREVGHAFPGGPNPAGRGVYNPNLVGSESKWWEFVRPGDPLAAVGDDGTGAWMRTFFDILMQHWDGHPANLIQFLVGLPSNVMDILNAIHNFFDGVHGPGVCYGNYYPVSGDPRPAYQMALDYIRTFTDIPNNTNTDPMSTYRREHSYQVYDTTGMYTDPIPWPKGDTPENYPGGLYGIHPDYAPAINPDGTPYIFLYQTQAEYLIVAKALVAGVGGLVTDDHYQMPLVPNASAARVFQPEYAIAYDPPAKDSTVSASLTRRRTDLSGQFSPEVSDPVNFVRPS